MARRVPPAEVTRWDNVAPDPHPTRSPYQRSQSFGWVPLAASGSSPRRNSKWVPIGDASAHAIFGNYAFTTGDQPSGSRGQRRRWP
jgi:hypothetical protein